jgi:hypothetical protein
VGSQALGLQIDQENCGRADKRIAMEELAQDKKPLMAAEED